MNKRLYEEDRIPMPNPKIKQAKQWKGYQIPTWFKKDKKKVTILYNYVERRKSYFLRAYLVRKGYNFIDMGDHIKEDVLWGKKYGTRMQCNPTYFTAGSLIRKLVEIENETGLSRKEISEKYLFLGGGGQCGPCRYGMYPQEYIKILNEAGFKDFRILIFSSDINDDPLPSKSAFQFNLIFRINILIATILADLMHIAECGIRPYTEDKKGAMKVLEECEKVLLDAFTSPFYLFKLPRAIRKAGKMISTISVKNIKLPLIYVTGEFFANLAHNDANYNLRRFIMDEGCAVVPALMTQRILYDNWRRKQEALRGVKYAENKKELKYWKNSLKKQNTSTVIVQWFFKKYRNALKQSVSLNSNDIMLDLDHLARLGNEYYHHQIFGGESNLEVAEAIYFSGRIDGFITSKPFGCMPSSGVSDGVLTKITHKYPELNYLSIETSGDNEVSILSRVSMLLFKSKQNFFESYRGPSPQSSASSFVNNGQIS